MIISSEYLISLADCARCIIRLLSWVTVSNHGMGKEIDICPRVYVFALCRMGQSWSKAFYIMFTFRNTQLLDFVFYQYLKSTIRTWTQDFRLWLGDLEYSFIKYANHYVAPDSVRVVQFNKKWLSVLSLPRIWYVRKTVGDSNSVCTPKK